MVGISRVNMFLCDVIWGQTLRNLKCLQFEVGSSSSHGSSDMNQTPSPSDSAVSDLETVLKEKDSEINFLRETMEQNEQVIFKVKKNVNYFQPF